MFKKNGMGAKAYRNSEGYAAAYFNI